VGELHGALRTIVAEIPNIMKPLPTVRDGWGDNEAIE